MIETLPRSKVRSASSPARDSLTITPSWRFPMLPKTVLKSLPSKEINCGFPGSMGIEISVQILGGRG